jgi:hypothetical protein
MSTVVKNKDWGPGEWHSIHTTAADADTSEKFKFFCTWVRNQVNHLPCGECTNNANAWFKDNPPEKAEDAFIWSWRFHNSVNKHLGKPEMEYNTAKQIYLEGGYKICDQGCDEGKKKATSTPQVTDTFSFRQSRF